jgi:hypothetical protein
MVENITIDGVSYAIIIYASYNKEGISFFTPEDFSQQLGYMKRSKGYEIPPHIHNEVLREVKLTQEVLYLKKGKIRVDFYTQETNYLLSKILNKGDVILLAEGGHGFYMLEESEIIEIKQGPYCGELDKTRFDSITNEPKRIKIK